MNSSEYTWKPTYKLLVQWLLGKQEDQLELIDLLKQLGVEEGMYDRNEHWERSLLREIDPFTFLSYLNKFGDQKRIGLLIKLHQCLDFQCPVPKDVMGLPTCNPMKVWLFPYKPDRGADDISNLWEMFRQTETGEVDEALLQKVLAIRAVGKGKLSIGWFYTNPDRYLTLDSRTCQYLQSQGLEFVYDTFGGYQTLIEQAKSKLGVSFVQISRDAWQYSQSGRKAKEVAVVVSEQKEDQPEDVRIASIAKLWECLFPDSKMEHSAAKQKTIHLVYRGHASTKFGLKPSIYRFAHRIENEELLFKEMEHSVPDEFSNCNCTFDKLVKMQHYELPTRLLDTTNNPLVALYFACVDKDYEGDNGVLFQFEIDNNKIKYSDSDAVSVVANIARRPISFDINEPEDIGYLYHEIRCCDKPAFIDCIDPKDFGRVFFVIPKRNNPRIIKQEGAFFLFGVDQTKGQCPELNGSFRYIRYLIPHSAKKEIEAQLNVLGINQASLFPEIDKVAMSIKDKYKKTDGK